MTSKPVAQHTHGRLARARRLHKWIRSWNRYWFIPATAEQLAMLRIASYGLLFAIYLPVDDRGWTHVAPVFWMPISAFRILTGPPTNSALINALQILWKFSLLASAIGFLSRWSRATAAVLGFFLLGLPNCFGKIHHLDGFPVLLLMILAIAPCGNALSVDSIWRRHARRSTMETASSARAPYGWPICLAQTLFLLVFFAAGYAKLRNSGLGWMTAGNMRDIWLAELFTHTPPTHLGSVLAKSTWACQFGAVATVAIELSALSAMFIRRWRICTLIGLFAMQLLIALMLGVYFTPHLAGYALFVPWRTSLIRPRGFPSASGKNAVHRS